MTEEYVMGIIATAMKTGMIIGAPCLVAGFVVGIVISLFQAVTQIHEATLTFIPKIIAIFGALLLFGPYILTTMGDFCRNMIAQMPTMVH